MTATDILKPTLWSDWFCLIFTVLTVGLLCVTQLPHHHLLQMMIKYVIITTIEPQKYAKPYVIVHVYVVWHAFFFPFKQQ